MVAWMSACVYVCVCVSVGACVCLCFSFHNKKSERIYFALIAQHAETKRKEEVPKTFLIAKPRVLSLTLCISSLRRKKITI